VFDLGKYSFLVELLHSTSKYAKNKVVLASTIVQGANYWDAEQKAMIVFPNPRYTENLSVRVTMLSPGSMIIEEFVTDVNVAEPLEEAKAFVTANIPDVITEPSAIKHPLIPKLELDFTANSPLEEGRGMRYSGGGDRLLPQNDTWVKQPMNKLVPGIVELADEAYNKVDARFASLRNTVPTGWTISGSLDQNYRGISLECYSFANIWRCEIFNYSGYFNIVTPINPIGDSAKGMLFGAYFILSPYEPVETFTLSLMFYDALGTIVGIVDHVIDATTLNEDEAIPAYVTADNTEIPINATHVAGRISIGTLASNNSAALTMELPQLINTDMVTYPIIRHRLADKLTLSSTNISLEKNVAAIEFIAVHNKKCYYFDTRNTSGKLGFAAYFNGGKLGLIVNTGGSNHELQVKWRQQWYDAVLDKDLEELPTDPSVGDRYLVFIHNSTLSSHINQIAEYTETGWVYTTPIKGSAVWVIDEPSGYVFTGVRWVHLESSREGQSSVVFSWNSGTMIRKIYGNGILLVEDTNTFTIPRKTQGIYVGSTALNTLHMNAEILRFLMNDWTNPKFDDEG